MSTRNAGRSRQLALADRKPDCNYWNTERRRRRKKKRLAIIPATANFISRRTGCRDRGRRAPATRGNRQVRGTMKTSTGSSITSRRTASMATSKYWWTTFPTRAIWACVISSATTTIILTVTSARRSATRSINGSPSSEKTAKRNGTTYLKLLARKNELRPCCHLVAKPGVILRFLSVCFFNAICVQKYETRWEFQSF